MLEQFVIYWNPSDYPGKYVARKWHVSRGGVLSCDVYPAAAAETLAAVRAVVPGHLVRIPRQPEDDHVIVEVWT